MKFFFKTLVPGTLISLVEWVGYVGGRGLSWACNFEEGTGGERFVI